MIKQIEVSMKEWVSVLAVWFSVLAIWGSVLGGWLTHVIVCIAAGKWGFLIAGALFFPIGIIHGLGVWIGAW